MDVPFHEVRDQAQPTARRVTHGEVRPVQLLPTTVGKSIVT